MRGLLLLALDYLKINLLALLFGLPLIIVAVVFVGYWQYVLGGAFLAWFLFSAWSEVGLQVLLVSMGAPIAAMLVFGAWGGLTGIFLIPVYWMVRERNAARENIPLDKRTPSRQTNTSRSLD